MLTQSEFIIGIVEMKKNQLAGRKENHRFKKRNEIIWTISANIYFMIEGLFLFFGVL